MSSGATNYTLSSLNKALDVLEAFGADRADRGLSELSRQLEIEKPTLHRLLKNLERRGYVRQDPATKRYRLGLKTWELGSSAVNALTPREISAPWLKALSQFSGEQVTLWVFDAGTVVCVDKVEGTSRLRTHTDLGAREPAWLLASGRCLLSLQTPEVIAEGAAAAARSGIDTDALRARLADIRRNGYEISRGDRWEEVCAVAAPILDHQDEGVAALAVSAVTSRFDSAFERDIVDRVRGAGEAISRELGGRAPGTRDANGQQVDGQFTT